MKIETDKSPVHNQIRGISRGLFSCGMCAQQGHWVKNEEVHWSGLFWGLQTLGLNCFGK